MEVVGAPTWEKLLDQRGRRCADRRRRQPVPRGRSFSIKHGGATELMLLARARRRRCAPPGVEVVHEYGRSHVGGSRARARKARLGAPSSARRDRAPGWRSRSPAVRLADVHPRLCSGAGVERRAPPAALHGSRKLPLMSLAEEKVTVCLSRLFALSQSKLGGALVGSVVVVAFVGRGSVSRPTRLTWVVAIDGVGQLSPGGCAASWPNAASRR